MINKDNFLSLDIDDLLKLSDEESKVYKVLYQEHLKNTQIKRAKDEKLFFDELESNGFQVDKIEETESCLEFVINTKEKIQAIPILFKHLALGYSETIKDELYRTLRTPLARDVAGQELIERFKVETPRLRWVIGHVLDTVATENDLKGLLELIQNRDFCKNRSELVWPIVRIMGRGAVPIFLKILEQEKNLEDRSDVSINIITALAKMKVKEGKEYAEYYSKHKNSEHKKLVKRALKKFNNINKVKTKKRLPQNMRLIKDDVIPAKHESSTDLDMDDAIKFIKLLATKIDIDATVLEDITFETEVEQTRTYVITLKKLIGSTKLYFQVFMDDIDTPGLHFFSNSKSLIKTISKQMDGFFESEGL